MQLIRMSCLAPTFIIKINACANFTWTLFPPPPPRTCPFDRWGLWKRLVHGFVERRQTPSSKEGNTGSGGYNKHGDTGESHLPSAFIWVFFFSVLNVCHIFRQAVNLLETEPELIFIKEEAYDDHPISQQISLPDNRKSASDFKKKKKLSPICMILLSWFSSNSYWNDWRAKHASKIC